MKIIPSKRSFGMAAGTIAVVLSLAACAAIEGRETAGAYIDDSAITTKVKADLANDAGLKSFQISVATMQGKVQLSGFVDSGSLKYQAGGIAANENGVRQVENDIVVRPKSN